MSSHRISPHTSSNHKEDGQLQESNVNINLQHTSNQHYAGRSYNVRAVGSQYWEDPYLDGQFIATGMAPVELVCPYHRIAINGNHGGPAGQSLEPMNRYLVEGPSEQYAVFHRPDTGEVSIDKGCLCFQASSNYNGIGAHRDWT
jgi:hypothetical protein